MTESVLDNQNDSSPIVVTVREEPSRRPGHPSTLYVDFDRDFLPGVLVAGTEYRVSLVGEISFVVMAGRKPTSIYFDNKELCFSKAVRETLDSHLRYYR